MGLPELKARIVTELNMVQGIGQVYDHLLYIRTEADEKAKLVKNGVLNVWLVTREGQQLVDAVDDESVTERHPKMLVQGFYALDEEAASEATFDALVDAVVAQLNADRRQTSNFGQTVRECDPPQLRLSDQRIYGVSEVLCHHCEIEIDILLDFLE